MRYGFFGPLFATFVFATLPGPALAAPTEPVAPDGGASLTVVAAPGLALPVSAEIFRGQALVEDLAAGEAAAELLPQQRARLLIKLGAHRIGLRTVVLRDGRGYCLIVKHGRRGVAAEVSGVGRADPGAAQGEPDRRCLAKAAR